MATSSYPNNHPHLKSMRRRSAQIAGQKSACAQRIASLLSKCDTDLQKKQTEVDDLTKRLDDWMQGERAPDASFKAVRALLAKSQVELASLLEEHKTLLVAQAKLMQPFRRALHADPHEPQAQEDTALQAKRARAGWKS